MRTIRILLLNDAEDFLLSLPEKARLKFNEVIHRVVTGSKDKKIFKKLEKSDFYEFRVFCFPNEYRLFAFWDYDEDSLIVATHGIVKKDQKLRNNEFKTMERIRRDYINKKKKNYGK